VSEEKCWRCSVDNFKWKFEEQAQGLKGMYDTGFSRVAMWINSPIGTIFIEGEGIPTYCNFKGSILDIVSSFGVWIKLPAREYGYYVGQVDSEEFMTTTDYDAYKQKINKMAVDCIFTEAKNEAAMIIESSQQLYSEKDKDNLTRKIFESMITK